MLNVKTENRRYKKEPNSNFITITKLKNKQNGLNSRMEQRKESLKWKIDQLKLSTLNNKDNKLKKRKRPREPVRQ